MLLKVHILEIKLLEKGFCFLPALPVKWDTENGILVKTRNLSTLYKFCLLNFAILFSILCYISSIFLYILTISATSSANFVTFVIWLILTGVLSLSIFFVYYLILNEEFITISNKCFQITSFAVNRK